MSNLPATPTARLPVLRERSLRAQAATLVLGSLLAAAPTWALSKKKFDFVVGVDGDFKAAKTAAAAAASSGKRFHIFFPDGEYDIGTLTGDANQKTTFTTPNVSLVGQSSDKTVIFNKSIEEKIDITATLYFNNADNLYVQDLTIFNKAVYGNTAAYNTTGRHVAVQEQSDKVIYRNVKLKSTQDTYYTKGTRTYWEGGEIHGTTDFICGGGDVYFNKVLLWEMKVSAITASQSNSSWGYVFKDCTVDGTVSGFTLGRSWGDARTVFLNTTMNKLPSAAGWGDPMNSVPKVFAEYKSVTSTGAAVDLSQRRKSYTKDATTVTLNPVLTDAEAAKYTLAAVLGGSDGWNPSAATAQVAAPVVALEGSTLRWADNPNALCWVLFKNGKYLANTTSSSYDGSKLAKGDLVTVRAANEMGGLGASSTSVTMGSPTGLQDPSPAGLRHSIAASDRTLRIEGGNLGGLSVQLLSLDGSLEVSRSVDGTSTASAVEIPLSGLKSGVHILRYGVGGSGWTGPVQLF